MRSRFERGFWSIRGNTLSYGFFEKQVKGDWDERRRTDPAYVDARYKEAFRMDYATFHTLHSKMGHFLEKKSNHLRETFCSEKRLCIFLDWLCSGSPYQLLARTYDVSKASVVMDKLWVVRSLDCLLGCCCQRRDMLEQRLKVQEMHSCVLWIRL